MLLGRYDGAEDDTGVSKHLIARFSVSGVPITVLGAHLKAFPTDEASCAQREAQARVLADQAQAALARGDEVTATRLPWDPLSLSV